MSWKNFACVAALSALIASPALAVPSLTLTNGGLDASGDWIWTLSVVTDADGSTASELEGVFTDAELLTGAIANATVFDTPNPSPSTLAWIVEDVDGILTGGLQTDLPTDAAVIAIGSDNVVAGTYDLATFTTVGPSTAGSLTTTVDVTGNVAQLGANNAVSANASASATAGDANLVGSVDSNDLNLLLANFGLAGTWSTGDFNGTGTVNSDDLNLLLANFGQPSASSSAANAVPEPSTAILGLMGIAALAARRRNG